MATIDLRPISQETIDQIGIKDHDLWLVKIGEESFGPFETHSLKQYSSENQEQFDGALASRMDSIDYKPFWENPLFQRRQLQAVSKEHEGPFWLLDNGLIKGPFSHQDIDKKIEQGLLVMTDYLSLDKGNEWKKICEIEGFDRRAHSPEELPAVPTEAVFDIGTVSLVEKLEKFRESAVDQLANLAHVGAQEAKVIQFKSDDVSIQMPQHQEVSSSLKWAIPTAAAILVTLVSTGYVLFSGSEESPLVAETEHQENFYQKPKIAQKRTPAHSPMGSMPSAAPAQRAPASVGYAHEPVREAQHESRYPTHVEMHDRPYEEIPAEREREPEPQLSEAEQKAPEEHSLVAGHGNNAGTNAEENSLDAAMNGTEQPAVEPTDRPIVEEASDF